MDATATARGSGSSRRQADRRRQRGSAERGRQAGRRRDRVGDDPAGPPGVARRSRGLAERGGRAGLALAASAVGLCVAACGAVRSPRAPGADPALADDHASRPVPHPHRDHRDGERGVLRRHRLPSTPVINALARHGARAHRMYAITHPSLPNYLALTGGSTFGIDSDCTVCSVGATEHRRSARAGARLLEGLHGGPSPSVLHGRSAGDYAKKHDPFMYYTRIADVPSRCAKVVPLTQLDARRARRHAADVHLDHPESVPRHARLRPCHRRPVPRRCWCPRCCARSALGGC